MKHSNHTISGQTMEWLTNVIKPSACVQTIHRLQGGVSSIVLNVTVTAENRATSYVLRQFDNHEWLEQEPDLALHEAECLKWAALVKVPTPELVAFDESGRLNGHPSVLMTKLEGTVVLEPGDLNQWLDRMAAALASIHEVNADDFPWSYYTYSDIQALRPPSWSAQTGSWSELIALAQRPRPSFKPCFIHRDYHPTNILWQDDKVSGIVDWVNACQGPAGVDIGHCRLNLALLYGVEAADRFLDAYVEYASSTFTYDPYWDAISLCDAFFDSPTVYPGWTDLGFEGLTDALIAERMDLYMISLVNRIDKKPAEHE
ncbi:phosphotransferase family protein [Paenibacillus harenae]|uniref:phosphotransferase family protein n=1 Tax=Paenibacillus harenae TaxID=306543 RepID=UPI0027D84619|nr:aminoglycoside phosphotransferase family protein [Paenibacillus harenae]